MERRTHDYKRHGTTSLFAALTTQQLRRGTHRSVTQLERAIREFIDAHHADPNPFVWTKTADDILASIARFAQRTLDAQAGQIYFANHWDRTLVSDGNEPHAGANVNQAVTNVSNMAGVVGWSTDFDGSNVGSSYDQLVANLQSGNFNLQVYQYPADTLDTVDPSVRSRWALSGTAGAAHI